MRKLPEITIREGNLEDYADLMSVADEFFSYGGTDAEHYDRAIFGRSAMEYLSEGDEYYKVLVAMHDDKFVGYYALCFNQVYSRNPMMYEAHFAVSPAYVASHAGRKLTQAAIDYGRKRDCLRFYAGATSGIKRFDKSIENMYSKLGFVNSGTMMRYEYNG